MEREYNRKLYNRAVVEGQAKMLEKRKKILRGEQPCRDLVYHVFQ